MNREKHKKDYSVFNTPKPFKTYRKYGSKEKCHWQGCDTLLSVYNSGKYCSIHAVKQLDDKTDKTGRRKYDY
jgi:hypothetical protein